MTGEELRHQIILQQVTRTADGAGGYTQAWSDLKTVWASVRPRAGIKRSFAGKLEADTTHLISIRFLEGVTTGMRILFGARVFQIHSVLNEDERGAWLHLQAVEGTGS
jgi:SPP1 family predicted phage head-tail adaptor